MIITSTLGGTAGAVASVLAGMWWGVGLLGLVGLYTLGGTISFLITLLITMKMRSQTHDISEH